VHAVFLAATLTAALLASACASTTPASDPPRYRADITRTEFGIPHVKAADFEGLGYGIGYAYAQDNFCLLAEKINQLNGERSRYFGPDGKVHIGIGHSISNRDSDFFFRSQFARSPIAASFRQRSPELIGITRGYAAGVNRYLRDTGRENLPAACRGAAWVRPVEEDDIYVWYSVVATILALQQVPEAIVNAQPPAPEMSTSTPRVGAGASEAINGSEPVQHPVSAIGSNAWAFGRDATVNGRGLVFGNPHWPWGNINQFYQAHLTIPGHLDVMGVTYGGTPMILIGFNRSVAWSHTVSSGSRSVIRKLTLASDSPTAYVFDGQRREMERNEVTIDVLGEDGALRQESRTFYTTHMGPLLASKEMPWSTTSAYSLTDMNLPNRRMMEQWLDFARAENVGAIRKSLTSILGVPFANTVAADAAGRVLYADYSVKPYVTDEMLKSCGGWETVGRAIEGRPLMLDGSKSACDPSSDPGSPQPGILPARLLPLLERYDYVANSNNTAWLTNARSPVTGMPAVTGRDPEFIGFRPQSGLRIIEARLAGEDALPGNRFDAEAVRALVFGSQAYPELGNHNRAAEVMRPAIDSICADAQPVTLKDGAIIDLTAGCRSLESWDGRHTKQSVGAHLFREFWWAASRIPHLLATPFDPDRPLETPRDPDVTNVEVRKALREALAGAIAKLDGLGIALDRRWGEVHTHPLGAGRIPIDGNISDVLNVMIAPQLTTEGYGPVLHGASYVQIVGFNERGPEADAVLLFGQSTDPESPFYFDQLQQLWVEQKWNRLPFEQEEVAARAISSVSLEE
jgi:acyl-homoserine-lactone acylase